MCDSIGSVGKYALFTRPELKVERVSYDVPSAFGGERDCGVNLLPSWAAVAHKTDLCNESYPFS